jgi:hypothetical protein
VTQQLTERHALVETFEHRTVSDLKQFRSKSGKLMKMLLVEIGLVLKIPGSSFTRRNVAFVRMKFLFKYYRGM